MRNHPSLGNQLAQIPEKTLPFPSLQIPAGHAMVDLPAKEIKHFVSLLGCTLTIEGFHLWEGEPFAEGPRQLKAKGLGAVPVWFVPFDTVNQAIQDGDLTIGELAGLPGLLVGYADQFNLVLHPLGSNPNPLLIINAKGQLDNGRQFNLHATVGGGDPFEVKAIKIEFK